MTCDLWDVDRYDRVAALCWIAGEDLNVWTARDGHAVAERRYAVDYVDAELPAKIVRQGIWSGANQKPSERRRARQTRQARYGQAADPEEPMRDLG